MKLKWIKENGEFNFRLDCKSWKGLINEILIWLRPPNKEIKFNLQKECNEQLMPKIKG